METSNLNMSSIELILLGITVLFIIWIIIRQIKAYRETRELISQLGSFFPKEESLTVIHTVISKFALSSPLTLRKFVENPSKRQAPTSSASDNADKDGSDEQDATSNAEYTNVELIGVNGKSSKLFKDVLIDTNSYLCKNVGTSADYTLLQDICERKIDSLETQISNNINTPLYLGLAGTFVGIIFGLGGLICNISDLFASRDMSPLRNLMIGVIVAMSASLIGLGLMIYNSSVNYKKALAICNQDKNKYYDFVRRELMPVLSTSMASSLNSLKGVLGEFIGKFGHNLDAYNNSAEMLNDNIEKQHLLLVEINKMDQAKMATQIAETFSQLKDASSSLNVFQSYQRDLTETLKGVDASVSKIDAIINSFDNFAKALNVVVENQGSAVELQNQFRVAIEKNFPTDSDVREMWRKEFDALSSDAQTVSKELNEQLKASTEYIQSFVQDNQATFESLSKIDEVLKTLVDYSKVQADCYKDLKQEILGLKQAQLKSQADYTKLNGDLLTAVKEMIGAIKTIKE